MIKWSSHNQGFFSSCKDSSAQYYGVRLQINDQRARAPQMVDHDVDIYYGLKINTIKLQKKRKKKSKIRSKIGLLAKIKVYLLHI